MKKTILTIASLAVAALTATAADGEFKSIFNGRDLDGWAGDEELWKVENGSIVGQSSAEAPLPHNKFLIWRGGKVANFELRAKVRLTGENNSGIQYRSKERKDLGEWAVGGYQCDIHPKAENNGMLYEEKGRGIIAKNPTEVLVKSNGPKVVNRKLADKAIEVDTSQWNEYRIIATGTRLTHYINGKKTASVIDQQADKRSMSGILALQLHAGKPMKVEFKDIQLREIVRKGGKGGGQGGKDRRLNRSDAKQQKK